MVLHIKVLPKFWFCLIWSMVSLLIAVEGDTPREGVKHFRKAVVNVGGRILGAIVNKSGRK